MYFVLTLFLIVSSGEPFAQSPIHEYELNDTKILIRFRDDCLSDVLRALPLEHGAALDSSRTGIPQVDDVIFDYGQPVIYRPFPFGASTSPTSVLRRWYALRFLHPVDVRAMEARLKLLDQVEAVTLIHAVPPIDVGRRPSGRED